MSASKSSIRRQVSNALGATAAFGLVGGMILIGIAALNSGDGWEIKRVVDDMGSWSSNAAAGLAVAVLLGVILILGVVLRFIERRSEGARKSN